MKAGHTRLLQERIGDATDAPAKFATATPERVPIVLIPDERSCFSCFLSVPSGVSCILHNFGKDEEPEELAQAGLQCAHAGKRIAYCVAQQACTYNAPVKSCPTADNCMIDCDLALVFQIGPAAGDVANFVYNLGARRFDEFLSAAVEEGIRHMIRTCVHTEVYELRGGSDERIKATVGSGESVLLYRHVHLSSLCTLRTQISRLMRTFFYNTFQLDELNKKFNPFGVTFITAAVTDVTFNEDLQKTLQNTTVYKSKIAKQNKRQLNEMDRIQMEQSKSLSKQSKEHGRLLQTLEHDRERLRIDKDRLTVQASSTKEVKVAKASERASVAIIDAEAAKAVAAARGRKACDDAIADAHRIAEQRKIEAEQEAETQVYAAEQALAAAKNQAEALLLDATAEAAAAGGLKLKRAHDLRMQKVVMMQAMGNQSSMVIAGKLGDRVLDTLLDTSALSDNV
jgi:regulator of protease activity HflC (stomatin/prohibitin superfamily)